MNIRPAFFCALLFVLAASQSYGQTVALGNVGVSVVVRVNSWDGGPLQTSADVSLNPEGGMGLDEMTGTTSEAQFDRVAAGRYDVVVQAPGYKTEHTVLAVDNSRPAFYVAVTLQRESSEPEKTNSTDTLLAPKARKEMEKGISAIKAGNYRDAQTHLEAARKLAPGDADINYLLGFTMLELKKYDDALKYLITAVSLNPKNVPALVTLGRLRLQTGNPAAAQDPLERAISIDAAEWRAHWLLAEAYERQASYEKAVREANLAIESGKGSGNGARLVLGEALAGLGRNEDAIQAFRDFLGGSPDNASRDFAQREIVELAAKIAAAEAQPTTAAPAAEIINTSAREPTANAETVPRRMDIPAHSTEPTATLPNWGPPTVAQAAPAVSVGVACPASRVLDGVAAHMVELVTDLNSIDAAEELVHEELDQIGKPLATQKRHFDYLVTIGEVRPGILEVNELRNGSDDPKLFPGGLASLGVPALALAFHPSIRDDYTMTCEGLGTLRGQPAWIVHFVQRGNRPGRLRSYRIKGVDHLLSMEGRAWISTDTFQIMRIETDLLRPMPEIQLDRDYMEVEYEPVLFREKNISLWLPSSAQMYFEFRKQRYHRSETLSHFRLFSVGASQKISQADGTSESDPPQ